MLHVQDGWTGRVNNAPSITKCAHAEKQNQIVFFLLSGIMELNYDIDKFLYHYDQTGLLNTKASPEVQEKVPRALLREA